MQIDVIWIYRVNGMDSLTTRVDIPPFLQPLTWKDFSKPLRPHASGMGVVREEDTNGSVSPRKLSIERSFIKQGLA